MILEVSGQKKKEKDAKVQAAKTIWVPAVNNLGSFGRWASYFGTLFAQLGQIWANHTWPLGQVGILPRFPREIRTFQLGQGSVAVGQVGWLSRNEPLHSPV